MGHKITKNQKKQRKQVHFDNPQAFRQRAWLEQHKDLLLRLEEYADDDNYKHFTHYFNEEDK